MTRAERLAQTEARAQARLEAQKRQLAQVHARRHAEDQKALRKRRLLVGRLVEASGLFVLDDTTLAALFVALAPLLRTPHPVAVLEGLLCDVVGTPGRSLAMATPTYGGVSASP
jgi:hypothetical protein